MFAILLIAVVALPFIAVLGACAVEIIATTIAAMRGESWESFESALVAHEEADLASAPNNFIGFLPTVRVAARIVKRHTAQFMAPVVKPEAKPEAKPAQAPTPRFVKSGVFSQPEIWGWTQPEATLGEAWNPLAKSEEYTFADEDFLWGFDLGFTKPIDRPEATDHNEIQPEISALRSANQLKYRIRRLGDHRRLANTPV